MIRGKDREKERERVRVEVGVGRQAGKGREIWKRRGKGCVQRWAANMERKRGGRRGTRVVWGVSKIGCALSNEGCADNSSHVLYLLENLPFLLKHLLLLLNYNNNS